MSIHTISNTTCTVRTTITDLVQVQMIFCEFSKVIAFGMKDFLLMFLVAAAALKRGMNKSRHNMFGYLFHLHLHIRILYVHSSCFCSHVCYSGGSIFRLSPQVPIPSRAHIEVKTLSNIQKKLPSHFTYKWIALQCCGQTGPFMCDSHGHIFWNWQCLVF